MTAAGLPDATRYLVGGPPCAVVVPARVCRFLDRAVLDKIRREHRGANPELDAVLAAVHVAGLQYVDHPTSGLGSAEVPPVVDLSPSDRDDELDSTAVALRLGVSRRQVCNLADRLGGIKHRDGWHFAPELVDGFLADRAAG